MYNKAKRMQVMVRFFAYFFVMVRTRSSSQASFGMVVERLRLFFGFLSFNMVK